MQLVGLGTKGRRTKGEGEEETYLRAVDHKKEDNPFLKKDRMTLRII